ncbi:hypothetical protein LAZ67_13001062 [Cordylochernes scorpioides]|uniref:Tropomodulin n=1 Tax=Cordylochernes scorpioides TaxID=51811 RepID=A0ABY6L605_9ARAC|nr:hypothetical protein LAZ67_13001062 [Cordylochernes scorpioides]
MDPEQQQQLYTPKIVDIVTAVIKMHGASKALHWTRQQQQRSLGNLNKNTFSGETHLELPKFQLPTFSGNAARLIRAFNISDENYPIAWQTLVNRFDKKSELAFKQIQNLHDLKNVKQESTKDLLDLLDTCNESIQNLSILGLERNNLSDMILIHIIQSKHLIVQ